MAVSSEGFTPKAVAGEDILFSDIAQLEFEITNRRKAMKLPLFYWLWSSSCDHKGLQEVVGIDQSCIVSSLSTERFRSWKRMETGLMLMGI